MKKTFYIINLALLVNFLYFPEITACRYTVREIGFSDLGYEPYYAYFFIDSDVSEEEASTLEKLSFALLYETNVKFEIINIEKQKNADALKYKELHKINSLPSLVLVTPGDESYVYTIQKGGTALTEAVWLILEQLVWSPVRQAIVQQLLQSYCVVLFIEGTDGSLNNSGIKEVNFAVKDIEQSLGLMPKIVNSAPHIILLKPGDWVNEKVLLQNLGFDEKVSKEPAVAVIYGRGRILGPVLTGSGINRRTLYNLLTIVGADCECGLDHSWILGRMLPLRWESSVQTELVKFLDFDVESPLIKTEMSQIVSLKPESNNPMDPMENNLLGYVEKKMEIEEKPGNISRISAYDIQKSFGNKPALKNNKPFRTILIVMGGLLVIVSIAGVLLYTRNKKKNAEK